MTKIIQCICKHPYQDEKYGKRMRVHNATLKPQGWRCTVCSHLVEDHSRRDKDVHTKSE